jgi:mRNA interferase MazF
MGHLRRGDVFFADMGNKCRPWLVVQNDTGNYFSGRTIVVPLTSKIKKELPTHCVICWGSIRPSAVQCEEITHVNVNPDWVAVEHLPPEIMRYVDNCLKRALGVD